MYGAKSGLVPDAKLSSSSGKLYYPNSNVWQCITLRILSAKEVTKVSMSRVFVRV